MFVKIATHVPKPGFCDFV